MSALGWRLVAPVVVALVATGCATSRQCTIPEAPLGAPPGPPLPARVGIAFPDGLDVDSLPLQVGNSGYRFPTGPAAVSAANRAAVQLFERPVPAVLARPVPGGPEAVLSFTLDEVHVFPGPFKPEAAKVKLTAVLRDARGEVARATATARADGEPAHGLGLVHCDATGAALGAALAAAATRVRDELGASPAVAAWVRDPARVPLPAGPEAPLPTPAQPPPQEGQRRRYAVVPRFLELDLVHGQGSGGGPGLGDTGGWGWGLRSAWDIGEYVALGIHGAVTHGTATWTPDPSQPTDSVEHAFFGVELMVRLRPGHQLRPWLGLTGAWQGVTWDHYFVDASGGSLVGSAGVDVATGRWGWLRLGLSYSSFNPTMTTGWSGQGTPPSTVADGTSVHQQSLWLSLGWVLDLGPSR